MSSSTSVSKNTWRALLLAAFIVLTGELVIRVAKPFLSGDAMHIKQIPQIARALEESQGIKILFLGNSMINNGIETDVVKREFKHLNLENAFIAKVNPDGTDLWDWHFLYKNFFLTNSIRPDIIVVGFGRDLLDDQRPANPSRLAGDFCQIRDLRDLMVSNFKNVSNTKEFILASVSLLYSKRETIRNRLIVAFVPFTREITVVIHKSKREMELKFDTRNGMPPVSYARLVKFIDMAQGNGSLVVLIAMPTSDGYIIRKELLATAEMHGAVVIDMREINYLSKKYFIDAMHLKPEGARILSHELAKRLIPVLLQKTSFLAADLLSASERPHTGLRGDFN